MIRINLLPPELRSAERTPLPRFIAMIAMIAITLGIWLYAATRYMEVGKAQLKLESEQARLAGLEKTVKDVYDPLKARLAVLETRLAAGKAVENERLIGGQARWKWTEAIDEVWDVIWKSPKVWITDFTCNEGGAGQGIPTGTKVEATLSMNVYAATKDFSGMTEFRRRLQEHPKIPVRFKYMNKPTSVSVLLDPSIKEGGKVNFKIELYAVAGAAKKP